MMINQETKAMLALAVVPLSVAMMIGLADAGTIPMADEPAADSTSTPGASQSVADETGAPTDVAPAEDTAAAETAAVDTMATAPKVAEGAHLPGDGIRRHANVVGEIVGHPAGKVLLSINDTVTLSVNRSQHAAAHQRYAVARRAQFVEHPETGRNMGYLIRVVGAVELDEAFGRYWSGRIISASDYITTEDWLMPFEAATESTSSAPADLAGRIVAVRDDLVLTAEAQVVYTDLGTEQGVHPGDEFRIIREKSRGRRGAPDRVIGALKVLATQAGSSSASITRSAEPIEIGDRLERLVPFSPAP